MLAVGQGLAHGERAAARAIGIGRHGTGPDPAGLVQAGCLHQVGQQRPVLGPCRGEGLRNGAKQRGRGGAGCGDQDGKGTGRDSQ